MPERNDEYPKMVETETPRQFTVARNPNEEVNGMLKTLDRLAEQLKRNPVFATLMDEPESIKQVHNAYFQALTEGRREEARALMGIIVEYDAQVLIGALKKHKRKHKQKESDE